MGITVDDRYHPDLKEAVRRLVDCFQPDRIYLFGSRARGDAREDSDYDILLVAPDGEVSGFRAAQKAYRNLWGLSVAIEVHVVTVSTFEEYRDQHTTLPETTMREGLLLYAA